MSEGHLFGSADCQKTMESSWMIEQQGKSEGGKEPPSRSINQIFELFQSSKICLSGAKRLFRHAERSALAERFSTKTYPRRSRADPIITCTKGQVGCLSDASLLPTSTTGQSRGREACNRHRKIPASPEYNVGLSGPVTHPAGIRVYYICSLLRRGGIMLPVRRLPRR